MSAPHPVDLFVPYVYGELVEHEAQRVQDHCAACAACARELALVRAASRLLARRVPVPPRPFFWTRLSARLDAEDLPFGVSWQTWVWVAKRLIPALIAVTVILTSLVWQEDPRNTIETYLIGNEGNGTAESGEQLLVDNQAISKETVFQSTVLRSVTWSD